MEINNKPTIAPIKHTMHCQNNLVRFLLPLLFITFHSAPAYAYLDPGSGSAIISVIAATIASLWHSTKSLFYRFAGNKNPKSCFTLTKNSTLVIFSEGKAYWGTFRPLIEELIQQKVLFRYRTLDVHDPALTIESEYMQTKRLPHNSFGLAELANIEAPLMLATTPNIGVQGYPVRKPKKVDNLMHVFHHVGDITSYKKHSLDHYDSAILVGDFQKKSIRNLEKFRGLKPKLLVVLGLPYLDDLYKNRPSFELQSNERKTILIGSSWGKKGCLLTYGTEFINALVVAGFDVIIRPHPQSFISEPEFIRQCKKETEGIFVKWDSDISPAIAMHKSHLLISDSSSLRFDYAFLYEKPIITLEIPQGNLTEFEAQDLDEHWHEMVATKIGAVVNQDSIKEIVRQVHDVLKDNKSTDLQDFRTKTVKNFGNCAPHIVKYLKSLQSQQDA